LIVGPHISVCMSVLSLIGGIDLDPNGAHSVGVEGTLSGLESIEFGRFLNTINEGACHLRKGISVALLQHRVEALVEAFLDLVVHDILAKV